MILPHGAGASRLELVVTCARGSSAHAATFGKHLIERHLGIPVAAAAPNIATVYRQPSAALKNQLVLTISQSGRSDDLTEFAAMAKARARSRQPSSMMPISPLAAASDMRVADGGRSGAERGGHKIVCRERSPRCCD